MGTDRRGPLAAFVVIAIIAAILLVTSVRSQAAPGWLDPDQVPAAAVAAPPPTHQHLGSAATARAHDAQRSSAGGTGPTNGPRAGRHAVSGPSVSARVQRAWLVRLGVWTKGA